MKKTAYFILLFLLGLNYSKAQEIGIYYGTNMNFLKDQLNVKYYVNEEGKDTEVNRDYITDWGSEIGLTYRFDASHAFSFEMAVGMQKLETTLKEDRLVIGEQDINQKNFGYRQNYAVLKPTFHYWLNDNWSFTGNAILRLGTGGSFYEYDKSIEKFRFQENGVFDANHLDMSIGINYETNYGIGAYAVLQKPLLNFNDAPVKDYLPTSILSLGISFRIETSKLSKFKR